MLVLYDPDTNSVIAANPTWPNRVLARLTTNHLDRILASGASPDSTVPLALRAEALARPKERRELARSIERLVTAPPRQAGRASGIIDAGFHRRVAGARAELLELVGRLRRPGPLSAEGLAQVRVLLTDGAGPLHQARGDLRAAVRQVIAALEPCADWA